jgi:hypothetical protein
MLAQKAQRVAADLPRRGLRRGLAVHVGPGDRRVGQCQRVARVGDQLGARLLQQLVECGRWLTVVSRVGDRAQI